MGAPKTSVLVSHPHAAAVANGVAEGLSKRGLLWKYVTGIAAARGSLANAILDTAARASPAIANRSVRIGPRELRALHAAEIAARAASRLGRHISQLVANEYNMLFAVHDAATAATPWARSVRAVYAYEDAALRTFRKARARGALRILDLASPHHAITRRVWEESAQAFPSAMDAVPREPAWKIARKDEELALASAISVASAFTRASLEDVGVRVPILVTPYGFPVDAFLPKPSPPAGPFTVLAVGSHDLRKGTPYLLEAWRRAELKDARLRLVGAMRLRDEFVRPYAPLFEHVAHRPRRKLWRDYHGADLLAFPTLGDGFGLVIQEAMCCATPVLTTRCGGGPECITDGEDGLLVPERDIEALVEVLRWSSVNRDRLYEMGRRARARAERWPWDHAGTAIADAVENMMSMSLT
jgi:glycosyltransferase involved in cell wall biosynthesis